MTYKDAIKNGFNLVNRNWQLVLVQIATIIISCIGFFLFIVIPLAVAFVMFGLDLTEITRLKDLFWTMRDTSEIISRYFGLLLVLIVSFIVYLLVVASIGIYVFAGSAGTIGRAVRDSAFKFNLNAFFSEGKKLFFPLLGFTAIIGLILIGVAFVLGICGGGAAAIISFAKEQGATLALFLGIFFSLLLIFIGLVLIVCTIALTLYGVASIIFKGTGPIQSVKDTARYLYRHSSALWLYGVALGGYIIISFLLILFGTPFTLIPIIGVILTIPYHIITYTVQSYLGLVIIGIVFAYYFETEVAPQKSAGKESETIAGSSTQEPGISPPQASGQEPPPQGKEGTE